MQAFFFFGTFVLLKKTLSESGLTYSAGALQFSALWMAVVVLQSGVALHGQKDAAKDSWEPNRARPVLSCCLRPAALHGLAGCGSCSELHVHGDRCAREALRLCEGTRLINPQAQVRVA
jgi:hypothetical protein